MQASTDLQLVRASLSITSPATQSERRANFVAVPSVATMEKMARALEISLYQLLYDGEQPLAPANRGESSGEADEWGSSGKDGRFVNKLCQSLVRMSERDRQVLMLLARILTKTQRRSEAGIRSGNFHAPSVSVLGQTEE